MALLGPRGWSWFVDSMVVVLSLVATESRPGVFKKVGHDPNTNFKWVVDS